MWDRGFCDTVKFCNLDTGTKASRLYSIHAAIIPVIKLDVLDTRLCFAQHTYQLALLVYCTSISHRST